MNDKLTKELKKRLGEGIIVPAANGTLLSVCDFDEYKQSKMVGGFVHQMPICLHVTGGGAGMYEEVINRYMSLDEAKFLHDMLGAQISLIESFNDNLDAQ